MTDLCMTCFISLAKGPEEQAVATGIRRLLALRESNPQLKADSVINRLFAQIVSIENEIAAKRAGYNGAVERYRARLKLFPGLLIARIGRFRDEPLITVPAEMRDMKELGLNL